MTRSPDQRRQQLGRIHKAKKQLHLDDDTYRSLLKRITGKSSSADMTSAERNAVIAEFTRLGFKEADRAARRKAFPGRPATVDERPMLRKVEALLASGRRPWSYAHALAKHMFNVARVEWLKDDQLHKVVAALQVDAQRKTK